MILEIDGSSIMVSKIEEFIWEVECLECGVIGEIELDARGYRVLGPDAPSWPRYASLEDAAQILWEAHRDDLYNKSGPFAFVALIVLILINFALWGRYLSQ